MPILDNSVREERYKDDSKDIRATWAAYGPICQKEDSGTGLYSLFW